MRLTDLLPPPPREGWGGGVPACALLAAALWALAAPIHAAPFTPASDAEVVERLPAAADPTARRVDSLRKQLASRPQDHALRVELARRYFDLAMAQGDPRYIGYALAALGPIPEGPGRNAGYWQAMGMLQQYNHDFDGALASLGRSAALDPQSAEAPAWKAAIYMVQARYPEAQAECDRMTPLAAPLLAQGCSAYVEASTGKLAPAFDALNRALAEAGAVAPELAIWQLTRLAEMAIRLQRFDAAEAYFKRAFALGITDQFLLAAYADFLLARNRAAEVMPLLADWERSDVLLLRLALAGKATGHARAADWAGQLRTRFADAARRGDRLHEQEEARFVLDIEGDARKAVALALHNYQTQKEPRDAEILLRAALAAGDVRSARPALSWRTDARYEDPLLEKLATQLAIPGLPAASAAKAASR